ncbi:MAG: hypothetical protein ABDI07_12185, partial [Candidatus Kryptonium sp.]
GAEIKEEYISKVFYIRREISYKDIAKAIRELNIKDMVVTESPEFNALIVSARKTDLERVEKVLEKYIKNTTAEKPILTKTLYVKYVPADEFRKMIRHLLSEVGEVYVLGAGITNTVDDEDIELREIRQRMRFINERIRFLKKVIGEELSKEEIRILERELDLLLRRQEEVEKLIRAQPEERKD